MSRVTVVVGGQAGSEAKGAVCGRLALDRGYEYSARVGGPNAGHTVYDEAGNRFALRQVPVAAVTDPGCGLIIAAGSEVDLGVLETEIAYLEAKGHMVRNRLIVDEEATVVEPRHADAERELTSGTTGKGIGAARAERALRKARRIKDFMPSGLVIEDTQTLMRSEKGSLLLEGTQGYILGSHAGEYPHCTSGDCKAIDMMAMAGLPPQEVETWVVLRTYPIRIAGDSGRLPGETTWADLELEPEYTTVTKKVRRVGNWNKEWPRRSIEANGPGVKIALMHLDYWWPGVEGRNGRLNGEDGDLLRELEDLGDSLGAPIAMVGTSPKTQLMIETMEE